MSRVAALFLAIIALLVGDVVGLLVVSDDEKLAAPKEWDPRVADVARFVEDQRGLKFRHPVPVQFLAEDDYGKAAAGEGDTAPGDDAEEDDFESLLRAIGLIARESDLTDAGEELVSEGTLAFYDFERGRIVVRGAEVTTAVRVTVAHELTHVLQDQHFDLDRTFDTDGEDTAFHAIVEGDADRIEAAYVEQLSDDDRDAYERSTETTDEQVDLSGVPDALVQLFAAPYALGDPLVDLIANARGDSGINDAIRNPPPSEEALFDPFTFLDGEKVKRVDKPKLGDGEKSFDDGDFGSVTWYVMLASHIPDHTALAAVDGWGGDSYVAYKAGGKSCLRARFVGDTPLDGNEMFAALEEWRRSFPDGAVAVEHSAATVDLRSCDTGGAVPPPSDSLETALVLPAARTVFAAELLDRNVRPDLARCTASKVVAAYSTEQLAAEELPDDAPDPARVGAQAAQACAREQQSRG